MNTQEVLALLDEGVLMVNRDLSVEYANLMAEKMLGLTSKELVGKTLAPVQKKGKRIFLERCHQLLKTCALEKMIVTDSVSLGGMGNLHFDLIAVPKNDKEGIILVLQDNSNQHRVLEMGKNFVANASHELRTPITIIRGFTETLQDLKEVPAEMLGDITSKILKSCERMDRLVRNLLTLADIENLPLKNLQYCRLDLLIEMCVEHLRTIYPETKIEIKIEGEPPAATGVQELLELAFFNLLENGVKYSKTPAHLVIFLKQKQTTARIAIQDRGIGISKVDKKRIFEKFYTVDKTHSRKLGGAGLGLSIVKTIVDKHEGHIEVSSKLGYGTRFTIELPSIKIT